MIFMLCNLDAPDAAARPNTLVFLSLIVALAAYLGAIRLAILFKLGSDDARDDTAHNDDHRFHLKSVLVALIPADIAFITAAWLLLFYEFAEPLMGWTPREDLHRWATWAFIAGVAVLSFHHLVAWGRGLGSWLKDYEARSEKAD